MIVIEYQKRAEIVKLTFFSYIYKKEKIEIEMVVPG